MNIIVCTDSKVITNIVSRAFSNIANRIVTVSTTYLESYSPEETIDLIILQEGWTDDETVFQMDQLMEVSKMGSRNYPNVLLISNERMHSRRNIELLKPFLLDGKMIVLTLENLDEQLNDFINYHLTGSLPNDQKKFTFVMDEYPILLVDDSDFERFSIASKLQSKGFKVVDTNSPIEALKLFSEGNYKIVITDIEMPIMDGITFSEKIKKMNPYTEIIFSSGLNEQETIEKAYLVGAKDYFLKPIIIDDLSNCLASIMDKLVDYSNYRVLIIDDDSVTRENIRSEFKQKNVETYCAANGLEGLTYLFTKCPDLVITDVEMPGLNGYEVLSVVNKNQKFGKMIKIVMSGSFRTSEQKHGIFDQDIMFIRKPLDLTFIGNQISQFMKSKQMVQQNENELFISTIKALIRALEARDEYTRGHSERVTEYALMIGQRLQLSSEQLEVLELAASLHDIGKIGVRDSILYKPDKLTEAEFIEIKLHPKQGADIINSINRLKWVANIIICHHERLDGNGYPNQLKDDRIPLESKIISVADTYDAMTSTRPYRSKPLDQEGAIKELIRVSGTQLCQTCVNALIQSLEAYDKSEL